MPASSKLARVGWFLLLNPVTRIVVGFVVIALASLGAQKAVDPIHLHRADESTRSGLVLEVIAAIIMTGVILGAYALFVRVYEKRWPAEVGRIGWLVPGLALGAALLTVVVMALRLGGWQVVESTEPAARWAGLIVRALAAGLVVATMEEVLLRGVFFRILENSLGSWIAVLLSALLFGLLHAGNPNATLAVALRLSLQAGVLLAAAYMLSRSLWFVIGIHCAWNALQQGVFGGALSGSDVHAIQTAAARGPDLLSGGGFGVEGSIFATIVCGCAGVACCVAAVRMGKVERPFWKRPEPATPTVLLPA
ncbi:MAG: CPBP family intramembrane metalloprotease [Planctomycetes bacterium]|nr:CPBP family intramembrane metalloprotease [Planctomycetota bacterium]